MANNTVLRGGTNIHTGDTGGTGGTGRVANSHAYGVILTHLTCYSRTHAIDKLTHAFKNDHTHTHAILINRKYSTIFYHCKTNCNIVYCFSCFRIIRRKFYSSFPCWPK